MLNIYYFYWRWDATAKHLLEKYNIELLINNYIQQFLIIWSFA